MEIINIIGKMEKGMDMVYIQILKVVFLKGIINNLKDGEGILVYNISL